MSFFETSGLKIDLDHSAIHAQMAAAFQNGTFERQESRLVRLLLNETHRVIEIGTCTGYVAMVAAQAVGAQNVFSYEANPAAVALARHHFRINGQPVDVTNALLAPRSSYDPNETTRAFPIAASLVSSSLLRAKACETVDVPVLCLEDQIVRRRANFMIVDIEGGEVDLLMTADLSAIKGIIMETHYRKAGEQQINRMARALYDKGLPVHLRHSCGEVIYFYRDDRP